MDSFHHPKENLSNDELLFGARIIWQAYCARPVLDEDHARFIELYGSAGSTFLYVRLVRSLEVQLIAGNSLFASVPGLRAMFVSVTQQELTQALANAYHVLSAPTSGIGSLHHSPLSELAQSMSRRRPFAQLRRDLTPRSAAAIAAGRRFSRRRGGTPLSTKRDIGRQAPDGAAAAQISPDEDPSQE